MAAEFPRFDISHPVWSLRRLTFSWVVCEDAKWRLGLPVGELEWQERLAVFGSDGLTFVVDMCLSALGDPQVSPSTVERLVPLAALAPDPAD